MEVSSGIGGFLSEKGKKKNGVELKGADSMRLSFNFDRVISLGDVDNFVDGAM